MTSINLTPGALAAELFTLSKKLARKVKATARFDTMVQLLNKLPDWTVTHGFAAVPLSGQSNDNRETLIRHSKAFCDALGVTFTPDSKGRNKTDTWIFSGETKTITANYAAMGSHRTTTEAEYAAGLAAAKARVAHVKQHVKLIKGKPTNVEEGVLYANSVDTLDDRQEWPAGPNNDAGWDRVVKFVITGLHIGVPAITITAPDGSSLTVACAPKDKGEFVSAAFYKWANGRGFAELVEQTLGETKEQAAERAERVRLGDDLANSGICPICEHRQRLHGIDNKQTPLMYQHGYQIPTEYSRRGWRPRIGSCFGSSTPPWEVSSHGARAYVEDLQRGLPLMKALLVTLRENPPTSFKRVKTVFDRELRREVDVTYEFHAGMPEYAELLEQARRDAAAALYEREQEIEIYTAKVKGWKRKPLYDEQQAGKLVYVGLKES